MQKLHVFEDTWYSEDFWICWLRIWRRRGSETGSHFGCITNLLLIHFWIYYYLLVLLIDFIINHN